MTSILQYMRKCLTLWQSFNPLSLLEENEAERKLFQLSMCFNSIVDSFVKPLMCVLQGERKPSLKHIIYFILLAKGNSNPSFLPRWSSFPLLPTAGDCSTLVKIPCLLYYLYYPYTFKTWQYHQYISQISYNSLIPSNIQAVLPFPKLCYKCSLSIWVCLNHDSESSVHCIWVTRTCLL